MNLHKKYPRDLVGYGGHPPNPAWPNHAKIAINFVLNYEEGGESSILHGDNASESFLSEITNAQPILGMRNMNMESLYEYGSREGFWRLRKLFMEREIPLTIFGVAMAMERNPAAVDAMLQANWEIASHGYRWIDYQHFDEITEREHMARAIEIQTKLTGQRPLGWYTGRVSPNTARLVVENGEFIYGADSYASDLPYYDTTYGKPQLIVPYALDTNDFRFTLAPGFNCGEQFFTYLKDCFDVFYAEGETAPKMMSIGLHCRITGRPARIAALARFLDYIQNFDRVWIARRIDIAQHWLLKHPFKK